MQSTEKILLFATCLFFASAICAGDGWVDNNKTLDETREHNLKFLPGIISSIETSNRTYTLKTQGAMSSLETRPTEIGSMQRIISLFKTPKMITVTVTDMHNQNFVDTKTYKGDDARQILTALERFGRNEDSALHAKALDQKITES